MAQSPLLTVGVWQRKSAEMSFQNKDLLISAVNKGFNAMAAVLSKDSDPDEVQDDSLRDLMYGVLGSLHASLKEWTEERKQVKETGEIFTQTEESTLSLEGYLRKEMGEISTQTDEDPLLHLLETPLHEASLPIDNYASNDLFTNPPPSFPIEPKEEQIESRKLPLDYQISASELMRDEMMFKEEDMANYDVIVPRDSMEEDMRLDDVEYSGMDNAVHDSLNEQHFEENDSLRTIQPSDVMDYLFNFNYEILGDRDPPLTERNSQNEVSMSIEDVDETVESQIVGEDRGLPVNDQIDNDGEEEDHPIDTTKDTSDDVVKKRRRSSRQASKAVKYTETMEDSDGDIGRSVKKSKSDSTANDDNMSEISDGEDAGPSMKASRSESSRKKRKSSKGEEESEDVVKKRRVSKKNETELDCPECEYRTPSVIAWMTHLRLKHSTSPALAGLALLCECGNESLSERHTRDTNHSNTTVIRKRDGPILRLDDEKVTPQCLLCEKYPRTAFSYVEHLWKHHKSTLIANGIYLTCACGFKITCDSRPIRDHNKTCRGREFTVHQIEEK